MSQSPNVEVLRQKIWGKISGDVHSFSDVIPPWNLNCNIKPVVRNLIILDDVWSLSVLKQLIFRVPGCKTLVVSRFKFPPSTINCTYELELLRHDEAISLFCFSVFGQTSVPYGTNETLVKQVQS